MLPIALFFPQVDLIHNGSWDDIFGPFIVKLFVAFLLLRLLLLTRMRMHLEESHNLRGCDSATESLTNGISRNNGHGQIWKPNDEDFFIEVANNTPWLSYLYRTSAKRPMRATWRLELV